MSVYIDTANRACLPKHYMAYLIPLLRNLLKSAFPARFKNLSAGEESYLFIRCFLYGEVLLN